VRMRLKVTYIYDLGYKRLGTCLYNSVQPMSMQTFINDVQL